MINILAKDGCIVFANILVKFYPRYWTDIHIFKYNGWFNQCVSWVQGLGTAQSVRSIAYTQSDRGNINIYIGNRILFSLLFHNIWIIIIFKLRKQCFVASCFYRVWNIFGTITISAHNQADMEPKWSRFGADMGLIWARSRS